MAVTSRPTRKRHGQQQLFRCGGKRKGAGRKPTHGRAGASHKTRDEVDDRDLLHVVLRTVSDIGNLRRREIYKAVRAASITAAGTAARREQFRICQLSIQHNHIHMLVEATSAKTLASGMQGFKISAARHINTALRTGGRRRRGSVFADRYHVVVIRSPQQARHVLAYVLGNWRKHGEDRCGLPSTWLVDPFSSAVLFADWKERWLQCVGWKRHGAISVYEVPGHRARPAARRDGQRRIAPS